MPEFPAAPPTIDLYHIQGEIEKPLTKEQWQSGLFRVAEHAQDQATIQLRQGRYVHTFRALRTGRRDVQSEQVSSPAQHEALSAPMEELYQNLDAGWIKKGQMVKLVHGWKIRVVAQSASVAHENVVGYGVPCAGAISVSGPNDEDDAADSPENIAEAIIDPDAERHWKSLRTHILRAEDTDFTSEQAKVLAPRLLGLALRRRDSRDSEDKAIVWSAIRTGASMLRPHEAEQLRPFLEPGHLIETSLVAVRMLGRIFEAQPPARVDEQPALAAEVHRIARSLLNPYAIAGSQSAAMAQIAVYALAAMASTHLGQAVEAARQLNQTWFSKQIARELQKLRGLWSNLEHPVGSDHFALLDKAIQGLGAA